MNYECRLAMLCIPPPLRPRGSRCSGIGVLKPGAALAGSVGIFSLIERVRGKKRDAGFSFHFLCPENCFGRKEAIPTLVGGSALGLPPAPSLQLQPGLQIYESKLSPLPSSR